MTIHTIISQEQVGFVPRRMIGEATHLLKLVQAFLDDAGEEEEGLAPCPGDSDGLEVTDETGGTERDG
eukprot:scaffold282012_cov30-Tisochrysis_lutea.AAC.3